MLRGPLLLPQPDRSVRFVPDGLLRWHAGRLTFVGTYDGSPCETTTNLIVPPFLDCHTHIPQWPIRGRFCDGVGNCDTTGRLLAGLARNVYPAEARCADPAHAAEVTEQFAADTLAHGVVGGSAYMTVHARATAAALAALPPSWLVGLVLMNQHCPADLRTDEGNLDRDVADLAARFGDRLVLTDRFAVAVDSPLRRRASALAARHGLRMQTHLNEQVAEKRHVESDLYPDAGSYTDVYRRDGLLARRPILAHCVHMRPAEFDTVAATPGAAIAHCPTSNAALSSGVMPLDAVIARGIPYAICTDVGASPTTSLLAEMATFLRAHAGRSAYATPSEALYRTTLGAAEGLGMADRFGTLAVGRPASFVEVAPSLPGPYTSADDAIARGLLGLDSTTLQHPWSLDAVAATVEPTAITLDDAVRRVVLDGVVVCDRRRQLAVRSATADDRRP